MIYFTFCNKRPTGLNVHPGIRNYTLTCQNGLQYIKSSVCQNGLQYIKEVGPLTAKLALSLIKFMKYGIVQFLLYE